MKESRCCFNSFKMKKDILSQFKNSLISRELANSIVGGYFNTGTMGGGGTTCNGVGCPQTGGSCSNTGTCTLNGKTYSTYSCTVSSNSTVDSLRNIYPNGTISGTASNSNGSISFSTINCTGSMIA
jgi:hypothetical protein